MFTTFDRYLLRRFLHVYVILFLSMYGLFAVIDGFTNFDAFLEGRSDTVSTLMSMGEYYLYQTSLFFDLVGSIMAVTAVMVVFALLHKHCEILPVLAAGIPTWRLLRPVVIGMLIVTGFVMANQEFVMPRIAHHLEAPRGSKETGDKQAEPLYDHRTHILISGKEMFLREQRMANAKFVLPVPDVAIDLTTLKATNAVFAPAAGDKPAGWILSDASPGYSELHLTEKGRKIVLSGATDRELFVVTDVSFDQLYNRQRSFKFVSTPELVRRIRNPSFDVISIRGQTLNLHARLTRPFLNVSCIFAAIPLIIRRESRSLIMSFAACAAVMGGLLGVLQLFAYLGTANLVAADLAAWGPIIACGVVGAWVSPLMQT